MNPPAPNIEEIGVYIPAGRISNRERQAQFGFDDAFLENKIGMLATAVKAQEEETSDLCLKAFAALEAKRPVDRSALGCVVVVTQNPDSNLPHVSAKLQGLLGLPERCACFDVSLGCSGYVHGLAIVQSFMQAQGIAQGLLFTADPYSKIIDPADKNTSLLFGDAATVTLLGERGRYAAGPFTFGTLGREHEELRCLPGGKLEMNGQAIFNFAARTVPADLRRLLASAGLVLEEVDRFLLHQGSKFIVDTLIQRARLDPAKVPFAVADYGNTISSSIPILLEKEIASGTARTMVLSGFGVGLAYASAVLRQTSFAL